MSVRRRPLHWAAALSLVAAAGVTAARQPLAPPDLVLVNGHVLTVDRTFSMAEAVAVTGERITAVGSSADVRRLAGPATRTIDLAGRTLIPGLMDNHLHSAGGGPGVDLARARTLADVYAAIAARVKATPSGGLVVSNSDWHEAQLTEQKTGWSADEIASRVTHRIITHGKDGATITTPGEDPIHVPVAEVSALVDPTGVGDAFRAGFLSGLVVGLDHRRCAEIGSVLAAHVIETVGTQEYELSKATFVQRLEAAYGPESARAIEPVLRVRRP